MITAAVKGARSENDGQTMALAQKPHCSPVVQGTFSFIAGRDLLLDFSCRYSVAVNAVRDILTLRIVIEQRSFYITRHDEERVPT